MQNSQLPLKWYKPFAADDAAKVEIPVTTANPLRASQSLGFPPLTMQPPESGGVPPEGEDFNGAMNQVARVAWWMLAGGALPFDAAWAGNANIVGYPQGATVATADLLGDWISTADNNTNNPDTAGTNWVPGYAYGATPVALTNANVTLTPAQAAKTIITCTGVLTANVQLILPIWVREWLVVNSTTGSFSVTVKTAAGSGVVVPQTGVGIPLRGDGTNIVATGAPGRWINRQVIIATAVYVPTAGTAFGDVFVNAGGGGGGGSAPTGAGQMSAGAGGGGGGFAQRRLTIAQMLGQTMTVGAAGAGGTLGGGAGGNGGSSSFGALVSATGGAGGTAGAALTATNVTFQGSGGGGVGANGDINGAGGIGRYATYSAGGGIGGDGGSSALGAGAPWSSGTSGGNAAPVRGTGGGGGVVQGSNATGSQGGAGGAGYITIDEYA